MLVGEGDTSLSYADTALSCGIDALGYSLIAGLKLSKIVSSSILRVLRINLRSRNATMEPATNSSQFDPKKEETMSEASEHDSTEEMPRYLQGIKLHLLTMGYVSAEVLLSV
jgi:hypothetical protein